jgi:radical SAM superfamily enzyme YgiQ (UPF0313 family)
VELEYIEVDDVAAFAQRPRLDFDLVALSTYTARAFDAYLVADAYRAHGVPVVFGGLHATVLPEEAAQHADAVVVGEGELTWPEVVRDFQRGGRSGMRRIYREVRPGQFPLKDSPMPRFDLLARPAPACAERETDSGTTGEIHRLGVYNRITIQTTRGCPWDCDFCAASKLYGSRYRLKPVEHVLEEVDAVRSLWRRPFIEFADDNTFVHKIQGRGISVCGCFIVGLDADTPEVFDELRAFIERSHLLEVQITVLTPFPGTRLYQRLMAEGRLLYPGGWDRCTLFDVNFRPRGMSVEQLEEGLMSLWRETWNAEALTRRKRYYRELLRAQHGYPGRHAPDEVEEYFALPTHV